MMKFRTTLRSLLSRLLLCFDVTLLVMYLIFRSDVLIALMALFAPIFDKLEIDRYQYLVWGGVLFAACAVCAFSRMKQAQLPAISSKGIIFFELMVLVAFILAICKSISQPLTIDPLWLLSLSYLSYVFEVITTAGAGYVFADFLNRIHLLFNSR